LGDGQDPPRKGAFGDILVQDLLVHAYTWLKAVDMARVIRQVTTRRDSLACFLQLRFTHVRFVICRNIARKDAFLAIFL